MHATRSHTFYGTDSVEPYFAEGSLWIYILFFSYVNVAKTKSSRCYEYHHRTVCRRQILFKFNAECWAQHWVEHGSFKVASLLMCAHCSYGLCVGNIHKHQNPHRCRRRRWRRRRQRWRHIATDVKHEIRNKRTQWIDCEIVWKTVDRLSVWANAQMEM